MAWRNWLFAAMAAGCLGACQRSSAATASSADAGPSVAPSPAPSRAASTAPPKPARAPLSTTEFARLFRDLSEPDRYFFSDNYVSNETSYLQGGPELSRRARKHGAYIGVGPEQNFTYIAETEPDLAFIVDIRRGNALEHLLYKAIFDLAEDRAQFLSLLVGRDYDTHDTPGDDANLARVLAHVDRTQRDEKTFSRIHQQLVKRIRDEYHVALSAKDLETLRNIHRAFFDGGLDLSFELLEKNGRKYPTLRELLTEKDANGKTAGFLGTSRAFRIVRRLERDNRVIPVVGDFAGRHALAKVAEELQRRHLAVSVFYVSNVEQYLMEPEKWKTWLDNVARLPSNEQSLFVRCYLDQGRRHPSQMRGHRTTTLLMTFSHFEKRARSRGYGSFYQLATDSG